MSRPYPTLANIKAGDTVALAQAERVYFNNINKYYANTSSKSTKNYGAQAGDADVSNVHTHRVNDGYL